MCLNILNAFRLPCGPAQISWCSPIIINGQSLNTADIGTPLTRSSNRADYVVEIYIDQFDQSTVGEVVFAGHFQIIGGKPYKVFATQSFSLSGAKVGRGDYPTMVASMQKLLFEVCNSAAAEILLAEQGTKLK
jgi:uncharacterized lipoprotein YmbA